MTLARAQVAAEQEASALYEATGQTTPQSEVDELAAFFASEGR